jgi:hypothetical protein
MLQLNRFFIRERAAVVSEMLGMKVTDTFDIFDPETGRQLAFAQEEVSGWNKTLRYAISRHFLPTCLVVRKHPTGEVVFAIRKGVSLLRDHFRVLDGSGNYLGYYMSKIFTISGGLWVYDKHDDLFAEVKGKWTRYEYQFITNAGTEVGIVSKRWSGLAQELFTTADHYVVSIN